MRECMRKKEDYFKMITNLIVWRSFIYVFIPSPTWPEIWMKICIRIDRIMIMMIPDVFIILSRRVIYFIKAHLIVFGLKFGCVLFLFVWVLLGPILANRAYRLMWWAQEIIFVYLWFIRHENFCNDHRTQI